MKIFNKIDIDVKSILKKGIKKKVEPFGCFLITGYMGTGKTYFAVKYASEHSKNYKIKTNIKSLHIPNANIEYFENLDEIYNDTENYCLYIIDEIGKKYTKECRADKDFYNFLQMSRKTKRICLLIHQEYYQVPFWLRGVCEEIFTTKRVFFLPLFITYKGFAILQEDTKEWSIDYNFLYIYKRNKIISSYYDTFETVNTL